MDAAREKNFWRGVFSMCNVLRAITECTTVIMAIIATKPSFIRKASMTWLVILKSKRYP